MNPQRDKTMVEDLLAYKARMDAVVAGPLGRRDLFLNALKVRVGGGGRECCGRIDV